MQRFHDRRRSSYAHLEVFGWRDLKVETQDKKAPPRACSLPLLLSPTQETDLRQLILSAREQVARAVDSGLVLLYWSIGHRIRTDVLKEKRAEYGEKILHAVSAKLTAEFGRGYGQRNLARMVQFAEVFPDPKILTSLMTKLGWTHFLHIIRLDDPLNPKARFAAAGKLLAAIPIARP